jgi:hypothetical protein
MSQRSDWLAEAPEPEPLDPFEREDLPSPGDLIDWTEHDES